MEPPGSAIASQDTDPDAWRQTSWNHLAAHATYETPSLLSIPLSDGSHHTNKSRVVLDLSLRAVPFGLPPMYPSTIAAIPAAIEVATVFLTYAFPPADHAEGPINIDFTWVPGRIEVRKEA